MRIGAKGKDRCRSVIRIVIRSFFQEILKQCRSGMLKQRLDHLPLFNREGIFDSIEVQVSGIVNSPSPTVNNAYIFMSILDAREHFDFDGITEIAVKTDDYNKYKQYDIDLKGSLAGYTIRSWAKINEDVLKITQSKKIGQSFIIFFIAIIALVGIVNTMLMSVYEKQKEIGTIKALGFLDSEVLFMFVSEGALMGFLGGLLGVILGALVNWYFVKNGLDFTMMLGGRSDIDIGYKVMGIVKSKWDIGVMINSMIACTLASILASYYPARKATKMQPVEALRVIQ